MNNRIRVKYVFLLMLFLGAQVLAARTITDQSGAYSRELNVRFQQMVQAVGEGTMTAYRAMERLRHFQESQNRYNIQDYRLMETCLEAVESGSMTRTQARARMEARLRIRDRNASEQVEEEPLREREKIREQEQEPEGNQSHDGSGEGRGWS